MVNVEPALVPLTVIVPVLLVIPVLAGSVTLILYNPSETYSKLAEAFVIPLMLQLKLLIAVATNENVVAVMSAAIVFEAGEMVKVFGYCVIVAVSDFVYPLPVTVQVITPDLLLANVASALTIMSVPLIVIQETLELSVIVGLGILVVIVE